MVIHKFPIHGGHVIVELPAGAEVLHVGSTPQGQSFIPAIWVRLDPTAEYVERHFHVVNTGQSFDDDKYKYIGTFVMHAGTFVGHVFEVSP